MSSTTDWIAITPGATLTESLINQLNTIVMDAQAVADAAAASAAAAEAALASVGTAVTDAAASATAASSSADEASASASGAASSAEDALDSAIAAANSAASIHGIPAGGTTAQVLVKNSGTDYDASWEDAAATGVTGSGTSGTLARWSGSTAIGNSTGIVNADVASGAAIAYSKLALTGAILNADLAGSIAYSKLALTGAILNADLAGSIAYSKLSLTGAILNADLAGSIAYSKLSLATSIVNADIATAAAIALSKLAGWPTNASGVLTNNGSGTLTWGTSGGLSGLTTGVVPVATSGSAIGNSAISDDGSANITLTTRNLIPDTTGAKTLGSTTKEWNHLYVREIDCLSASLVINAGSGSGHGVTVKSNFNDVLRIANDATNGSGIEVADGGACAASAFQSRASHPATAGVIRLGNTEAIEARNAANSANISLMALDASNILQFYAGAASLTSGGAFMVSGLLGFEGNQQLGGVVSGGSGTGTLTNLPGSSGNPAVYVPITIAGSTYYIPCFPT